MPDSASLISVSGIAGIVLAKERCKALSVSIRSSCTQTVYIIREYQTHVQICASICLNAHQRDNLREDTVSLEELEESRGHWNPERDLLTQRKSDQASHEMKYFTSYPLARRKKRKGMCSMYIGK